MGARQDLDLFGPSIFLCFDFSKDRKEHRQVIPRELADKLAELAKAKLPNDRLLGIPKGPDPAAYITEDYTRAGVKMSREEGRASWHSLRKVFINNVVQCGADLKTIMTLARHSSATMSMDVYAKAKPDLLRATAEAATERVKKAVAASACCTGVASAKVVNSESRASEGADMTLQELKMVGDTGFEPVTPSLSSWCSSQLS